MMTHEGPGIWNEAALTDDEGRLDRPLAARAVWQMPTEVRLRHGRLEFWRHRTDHSYRRLTPSRDLLTKFAGLVASDEKVVLKYAQRWGPLGLCDHDVPFLHHAVEGRPCGPTRVGRPPIAEPGKHLLCCESIASWKKCAAEARELVNLSAKTHLGQLDREWFLARAETGDKHTLGWQERSLVRAINRWVELGDVNVWVTVQNGRFDITLGRASLFSALATQLAFATVRTRGFAVCVGCGRSFYPGRRPNPSRANYCPTCGRSGALRDAQRRRRLKVRVQKLFRELGSSRGVARQLGIDVSIVNKYIRAMPRRG